MAAKTEERPAPNEAQHEFVHEGAHPDLWPAEGETKVFVKEDEEVVDADEIGERTYNDDRAFSGHERTGKVRGATELYRRDRFSDVTEDQKKYLGEIAGGKTPQQVMAQARLDAIEAEEKAAAEAEKASGKTTASKSTSSSSSSSS